MLIDRDVYLNLLDAHLNKGAAPQPHALTAEEIALVKQTGKNNKSKLNGGS